ncbi:ATP-binding protein [Phenylobacterium aquaticum]|uniref:ATP-binding protein n=1 Tax=Phenylobacterium aquaticum TaxID=1763816 RepID=UPI001F5CBE8F|nr:ATP-binding protein [Phenylobacterium aquaticum]MCI3133160.1 response regulator [Phenylobacterium aquaticum]
MSDSIGRADPSLDYRLIFEGAPTPYLLLRPDPPRFSILAVNDAYLSATGTARAALVGKGLFEAFPDNPNDASSSGVSDLRASLDRALRDRTPDAMGVQKYDIPRHDGSGEFEARYWSPVNTPIPDGQGQVAYLLHRVQDVTAFMQAREAGGAQSPPSGARGPAEAVEAEVLRAGAALKDANRQLKHAGEELARVNEKLRQADQAKSEFFANVSHELRTPLTLILGPLDGLIAQAEADRSGADKERLQIARRNARRLLRLVNALLDFSRLEAGRDPGRREPTDLAAFTAELTSSFASAFERANLSLVVDCPPLSGPMLVARDAWEKIVLNLVSNAYKFTPSGGVTVRLSESDGQVRLRVEDTGIGIAPEDRDAVFERFRRIDGRPGRGHEGSGIGLALVRDLAAACGGSVAIESALGRGSAFLVTLPSEMRPSAPHDAAEPESASLPPARRAWPFEDEDAEDALPAPAPEIGGARVLLVDDNPDMRSYLARVLLDAGHAVVVASNVEQALRLAAGDELPDLVLTDVMMPGGPDGFALLSALRTHPRTETLPVLLLSARAGDAARIEGLAAGADDYLVKPFGVRELLARIEGAIRLARLRARAAERERELEAAQASAKLGFAMEAAGMGEVVVDMRDGRVLHTPGFARLFGHPSSTTLSLEQIRAGYHPEDQARVERERNEALDGTGQVMTIEHRVRWPDGSVHWLSGRGRIARDAAGIPGEVTAVYLDVTERREAEERQRLLIDELNHRVKNTLAAVQSIALLSRRGGQSASAGDQDFEGRLVTLASAHDLLTAASWTGAMLEDILSRILAPYRLVGGAARISLDGPPIRLSANAAVTLSMAFHELATNAAKYGAFSTDAGRLDIAWTRDERTAPETLDLAWAERGGPPVSPPVRRGFGSRLLERGLAREIGGQVELDFRADGLRCGMRIPMTHKVALG